MTYAYDDEKIHAVTGVQAGATILFSAEYDDNGSMTHKLSGIDGDLREHYYVYDSEGRMTGALDSDSARISDSFYHLQGGRVFEGRIGDVNGSGFVQGSLSVNPYFELKISSGDAVYMVKHVVAGGRRVASVYEQVSDYSARGMGCASIGSRVAVAGHRECLAAAFAILFVPLFIALLVGTRFFTRGGFREHPLRSALALIVLVVFLVEFSPLVSVDLDLANPLHKKELYKNLNLLLNAAYQNGKIPESKAALEFFENLKHAKSSRGLRLSFGPRNAKADVLVKDILFFHNDQLGSNRLITKKDGSIYQYSNYLPFGKIIQGEIKGADVLPDYAFSKNRYTGQEFDTSTGLHYFKARFYDADLATFIQGDPVIANPQDSQAFNPYNYCRNNPFRFTDPTGNFIIQALVGVVNAVICGVSVLAGGGSLQQAFEAALIGFAVGVILAYLGPASIEGSMGFLSRSEIISGMAGGGIGGYSAARSGGNIASGIIVGTTAAVMGARLGNMTRTVFANQNIPFSEYMGSFTENFLYDAGLNIAHDFSGGKYEENWWKDVIKDSALTAFGKGIVLPKVAPHIKKPVSDMIEKIPSKGLEWSEKFSKSMTNYENFLPCEKKIMTEGFLEEASTATIERLFYNTIRPIVPIVAGDIISNEVDIPGGGFAASLILRSLLGDPNEQITQKKVYETCSFVFDPHL